jgi:hypothetical protein
MMSPYEWRTPKYDPAYKGRRKWMLRYSQIADEAARDWFMIPGPTDFAIELRGRFEDQAKAFLVGAVILWAY